MEIQACPQCGSTNIFQGTIGDGVLTGYTTRQVCRNCGFQGMPIIFNTEKDYQHFLKQCKTPPAKPIHNESMDESVDQIEVFRPKGLFVVSGLLFIEAVIVLFLFITHPSLAHFINIPIMLYLLMFVLSGIILPIGFLSGFSWSYLLAGILFIFTIPINLPFLYYITRPHVKNYLLRNKKEVKRN